MSKIDWVLIVVFILGFVLFLYGANIYNASVGYGGIYLSIGSIAVYILIFIYKELKKREICEAPPPTPAPTPVQAPTQNP
jgi:hypothetical protein